ncbi:DUF4870 domain-containing protein [Rubrivirga sp.]|uniref:DUF4870 domain-containing protein n=1 Tax=Rubrivirga sp. TaxID=1885344 RepID=UPI003C751A17
MPTTIPHTGPYDSDFDDPLFDVDLDHYEPSDEECTTGMFAHLAGFAGLFFSFALANVIGPAIIYYVKRDQSAFVEDQAREAINFQITTILAVIAFVILSFVVVGIPLLLATVLLSLILPIRGAMAAHRGERYRYPFSIRFLK